MSSVLYIPESKVHQLLNWDKIFEAVERAMESVSKNHAFQNRRLVTKLGNSENFMFTMPGYLVDDKYPGLGCKLFTYFPNNPTRNQPALKANFFLLDETTGDLKAVLDATQITDWRTAAASAVATKHLHPEGNNILAILGAGAQGKAHAEGFQHLFKFDEVRIWNRTSKRAREAAAELNQKKGFEEVFVAYDNVEECVKGADVIVTATSGNDTYVKYDWVKKGAHINAIRVNPRKWELDDDLYKSSSVYVDYWEGAENELQGLKQLGAEFKGQIGDIVVESVPKPNLEAITIFQSLGMAVEDCAVARLVYDLYVADSI